MQQGRKHGVLPERILFGKSSHLPPARPLGNHGGLTREHETATRQRPRRALLERPLDTRLAQHCFVSIRGSTFYSLDDDVRREMQKKTRDE
jgi:hypothetical protein